MTLLRYAALVAAFSLLAACSGGGGSSGQPRLDPIVVDSLLDSATPAPGTVTLRSALSINSVYEAATADMKCLFLIELDRKVYRVVC